MRCLVTGGAGFIGSNLVDELLSKGHEVITLDNETSSPSYWNNEAKNFISKYWQDQVFSQFKPDWVFHLAAQPSIQECIEHPYKSTQENFNLTIKMLELSRNHEVKKFIFSSTSAVYGLKNSPPLKESMKTDCLNPYSAAKLSSEKFCKLYYNLYGLKTVSLRYFNVYGERQRDAGQYAPVIGTFLNKYKNKNKLTIVGDGKQIRDYIHVKDVVRANILAAESNKKEVNGDIFNVGSGKGYSILDLVKIIGGDIEHIPAREGEARVSLSDISKIKEVLGWTPTEKLESYIEEQKKILT